MITELCSLSDSAVILSNIFHRKEKRAHIVWQIMFLLKVNKQPKVA